MRSTIALVVTLLVSACSDPVKQAEEEHRIAMREATSKREKCGIEKKLAAAYLAARDQDRYSVQRSTANLACAIADTEDLLYR